MYSQAFRIVFKARNIRQIRDCMLKKGTRCFRVGRSSSANVNSPPPPAVSVRDARLLSPDNAMFCCTKVRDIC